MRAGVATALLALFALALAARAQTPHAVPITQEPHHHLVFQNDYVRVFRYSLPPGQQTLLHEHDLDYLYIALGPVHFLSKRPGEPDRDIRMAEGTIRFARGGFAHAAYNLSTTTDFRSITIEFRQPQGAITNACTQADPAQPLHCPEIRPNSTAATPEFSTAHAEITLLRIEPGGKMALNDPLSPRLLAALDGTSVRILRTHGVAPLATGGQVWLDAAPGARILNNSRSAARILSILFPTKPAH